MFLQNIGKSFIGQILNCRHPIAPKLGQLVERVIVEGDQFSHAADARFLSELKELAAGMENSR